MAKAPAAFYYCKGIWHTSAIPMNTPSQWLQPENMMWNYSDYGRFSPQFQILLPLRASQWDPFLQMVGDAMLSFYCNTQAASATKVSLWLTDNSTGSECGKPRSTCYSHWLKGTCHWHKSNSTIIALSTWVMQ